MSDDSDSSEYDSDSDELNTIGDGVRFRVFFFFELLSDFFSFISVFFRDKRAFAAAATATRPSSS